MLFACVCVCLVHLWELSVEFSKCSCKFGLLRTNNKIRLLCETSSRAPDSNLHGSTFLLPGLQIPPSTAPNSNFQGSRFQPPRLQIPTSRAPGSNLHGSKFQGSRFQTPGLQIPTSRAPDSNLHSPRFQPPWLPDRKIVPEGFLREPSGSRKSYLGGPTGAG